MTTSLHITQIVDRIEASLALGSPISRVDVAALELLLNNSEDTTLHRPMERLVMALKRERETRDGGRFKAGAAYRKVVRRLGTMRAALAQHARDVAAHSAGIELHA